MPEPGKLESGKEAQPEDEVLPESTSPTARQAAVVPASEAVAIELPPHAHAEPPGWVYQTFFLLSILQLLFVALTTRYWASVLHWLTFQRNNPIKAGRSIWMYEVLGLTAVHLVIFFFAVTSGLGVFIAATWQKARQNPTGVDERVRLIGRVSTFIALYDLPAAILILLVSIPWFHLPGLLAGCWMLVHFGFCITIARGTRKGAQEKHLVSGDLEYTIESSILLVCSVEQMVGSVVAVWLVLTGFQWSNGPEGFAAFCYLVAILAAFTAGYFGLDVCVRHLSSNNDELVSKDPRPACFVPVSTTTRIRTAWLINMVNMALGGILAAILRGHRAIPDTVSVIVFLGITVAIQARMYYLTLRFTDKSAQDAVVAYVHQAQTNLEESTHELQA